MSIAWLPEFPDEDNFAIVVSNIASLWSSTASDPNVFEGTEA
jgi:hypothetical protein